MTDVPLTIALFIGALAPAIGFALTVTIQQRRQRATEKAPVEKKLLRPAGYSLALRLDDVAIAMLQKILWATVCSVCAGLLLTLTARFIAFSAPLVWVVCGTSMLALIMIPAVLFAKDAVKLFRDGQNIRLGMRGEQAVAETLYELADCGYKAFHDLQGGDDWNIDHVAVGRKGVFLIETKTRRRRARKKGKALTEDQPNNEVRYDGAALIFPFGENTEAVEQAQRNARWLEQHLLEETQKHIPVEALIVLPGWFVKPSAPGQPFQVKAMNCTHLAGHLRGQNEKLSPDLVKHISSVLAAKCRTLEFE